MKRSGRIHAVAVLCLVMASCRHSGVYAEAASMGQDAVGSPAPVFQYRLEVPQKKGTRNVFLWIPPEAGQVRGVIFAGMTLMEQYFSKDPVIRKACAEAQLAIVFTEGGLGRTDPQKTLDDFAKLSGYEELSVAPLMFVGHSAGGGPALKRTVEFTDRSFGLVQYRGGMPSADDPIPTGIPSLAMMGQFDEFWGTMRTEEGEECWERGRKYFASFRATNVANIGTFVVEPGAGHFAWSDRNAEYLSLFITKAAQARIPKQWDLKAKEPVELLTIDHTTGWLTDFTLRGETECAPFTEYKGDKTKTSWHFDKEMAEATLAYHKGLTGKKDQFLKWNDKYWVDAGTRFFFTDLKWVGDGQTLAVHPVYSDTVPAQHNNQGPKWLNAGAPAGHSEAPIRLKPVAGPMVATGPNTFRFQYDALAPAGEGFRATFMAYSEGDDAYRYTELVGMMPRGFKGLNKGKDQAITFPELADMKTGGKPQELKATSDAGTKVEYYVAVGPAVIEDGKVKLAQVPKRAKFPIEVTVVACHFGSGVEPLVKTAAPAERTFKVGR